MGYKPTPAIMQSVAVVALALLESVQAFQAPALASRSVSKAAVSMFSEGDIGVLPPLGVFDPLGLIETRDMRRYEVMEVKHGRAAMLGFLHVIAIEAGIRIPIDDCAAAPAGLIASLEAVPTVGWLQIMLTTCMIETGTFASNAERQNGRAAMLGITGCLLHELLGVDALYPTGGMGGDAPPAIF